MWVWGNPEMATEGQHTVETFVHASPAERAAILGVPNVIMAGQGLPDEDSESERLTSQVAGLGRMVWEISPDGKGENRPFEYRDRMAQIRALADKYPKIEGVLLDDMSTVAISHGFKPEHVRRIREELPGKSSSIKIWGVVYTMSLNQEGIGDYIQELDVINLWTWHAKDIVDIEKNVALCEQAYPGKPIVLGLYLYDYGGGGRIPPSLLKQQCETALALAHAGRIKGIVFLTINNDPGAVTWTANWIKEVGGQQAGSEATRSQPSIHPIRLGDSAGWTFSGEPWSEDGEGVIRPPDERNLASRAFYHQQAFRDFTADFEFNGSYRETGTGSAGLIIDATDPGHFYYVYFPWGGQQLRAKHFWAAVAKVDETGYIRNIEMEWVPGVPSETERWYRVRVEAQGGSITVWVDGRRAVSVAVTRPARGCIGLAGYGWYAFRNIRVAGNEVPQPDWKGERRIPSPSFEVGLDSKGMPSGCVAPNGDVLLAAGTLLVRSTDKGHTWSEPAPLPEKLGPVGDYGSSVFRSRSGRLFVMIYRTQEQVKQATPEISISESTDNGLSWSDPVPSEVAHGWPDLPKSLVPYGPLVETDDGTLLRFLLGGVKEEGSRFTDVRTWSATHCKAFAIRSVDAGKSWSAPIELDRPAWTDKERGTIPGSLDFTEPTGVALGNKAMVLIRPIYSPMMWQCWSQDSGATWDAAARVTFPGYAQSMVRTQSGAILCAHRFPHYAVNISRDEGLNWDQGTIIDYPVWAMGCLVEVEPNVVLSTYMNARQDQLMLSQLIRVTPDGIEPFLPGATNK
jgi:hypothetical protein